VDTLRAFDIDIYKLSNKEHLFEFVFSDSFFEHFDNSPVEKGSGDVTLNLTKTATMMELFFRINGQITLICDRSLEPFKFPLGISRKIILKYGDSEEELSDEIAMIHWETQRINVAQYIYEFIGLEIPMKKLHPKYEDDNPEDEVIYTSAEDEENNTDVDPRWEVLKKLKK